MHCVVLIVSTVGNPVGLEGGVLAYTNTFFNSTVHDAHIIIRYDEPVSLSRIPPHM